jgi:hypothetical protein
MSWCDCLSKRVMGNHLWWTRARVPCLLHHISREGFYRSMKVCFAAKLQSLAISAVSSLNLLIYCSQFLWAFAHAAGVVPTILRKVFPK